MAVEELVLPVVESVIPEAVAGLIREADRRIDHLFESGQTRRFPRFIPSDAALFYFTLAHLTGRDLPLGRRFCEWGSGLGVGTCIASLLGYEAYGIEIEPELARRSRELARELAIDVQILCTSYIPDGLDSFSGQGGTDIVAFDDYSSPGDAGGWGSWGRGSGGAFEPAYEGMGADLAEIDVFYVYPWPGEQEFMQKLFDIVAVEGAILIAYHGDGEMCIFRKICDPGTDDDSLDSIE